MSTNLEQAAFEYTEAKRGLEAADEAGASPNLRSEMQYLVRVLHAALLVEAERHFDNTHDGATV